MSFLYSKGIKVLHKKSKQTTSTHMLGSLMLTRKCTVYIYIYRKVHKSYVCSFMHYSELNTSALSTNEAKQRVLAALAQVQWRQVKQPENPTGAM